MRVLCPQWIEGGHDRAYTDFLFEGLKAIGRPAFLHVPPRLHRALGGPADLAPRPPRRGRRLALDWPPARTRLERLRFARLAAACARAFEQAGEARWLVHTADWRTAEAVLQAWTAAPRGRLRLLLRYDHYDVPDAVALARRVLALAARDDVRLLSDSADLIALFARLHPVEVGHAPPPRPLPPQARSGPPLFAVLGAFRPQKGAGRAASLITGLLTAAPGSRAVVQTRRHPDDAVQTRADADLQALAADPRVTLLDRYLPEAQFQEVIRRAHVLVLDYDSWIYRASTSGIFALGVGSGAAALCPPSGWMAEEGRRHRLARVVACDLDDPEALAAGAVRGLAAAVQPLDAALLQWAAAGSVEAFAQAWLQA